LGWRGQLKDVRSMEGLGATQPVAQLLD
jgi:hypothetical protein